MKYRAEVVELLHQNLFGPLHASCFDFLHRRKDYRAEADQILEIFAKEGSISSVLDLGCGTAHHLELLAEAGHAVVGVDRSVAMAQRGSERLARFGGRARVVEADLFDVAFGRTFDAVLMMFSLLGYFVSNERVLEALRAMGRHLEPGGLVVFDVEDAASVLRAETPMSGGSMTPQGDHSLLIGHKTSVDTEEQVIESHIFMWQVDGDRVLDQVDETHLIRYFQKRELRMLLETAGFEMAGYAPLSGVANNASQPWLRLAWARKR
jgi:SAM-dependent methyltransferase